MKKICIISTTGSVINAFMLRHIEFLMKEYDITIVLGDNSNISINCKIERVSIKREIDLYSDIKSLLILRSFLKKQEFDIVLSIMPKSGLLAMVASFSLGMKTRVHFFTGQVWATKNGLFKWLLKTMDKLIVLCSSSVLIDSDSQKSFLEKEKVLVNNKGYVLNKGSISGVNLERFKPNNELKIKLKNDYKISNQDIVFMFLGRITYDKGILELYKTFLGLFKKFDNIKLVIMGPLEDITLKEEIAELLKNKNVISDLNFIDNPHLMLNIADILVLPSHREGFGTIVIEAAAMKIPTIGSKIYGLTDSIVDNHTGILHEVNNVADMIEKYSQLIENQNMISKLGENAYKRVHEDFNDKDLSLELVKYIKEKVNEIK